MKKEELELILSVFSGKEIVLTPAQFGMVNYNDFSDVFNSLGFTEIIPVSYVKDFVVLVECKDKSFVVTGDDQAFIYSDERLLYKGAPDVENVRCYAKVKGSTENLDKLPLDILWLMSGVSGEKVAAKRLKRV